MMAKGVLAALAVALMGLASLTTMALPAIDISHPMDGGFVTKQDVNVSGTAPGTDILWQLSNLSGFPDGTFNGTVVDRDGNITLTRPMSDDFDDDSLDTSKWTPSERGGLGVYETGQALHMKGKQNSSNWWSGYAAVMSLGSVGRSFEINLTSVKGTGSGYLVELILWNGPRDYYGLGHGYDRTVQGGGGGLYEFTVDAAWGVEWSSADHESFHQFKVTHGGNDWDITEVGGFGIYLGDFKRWKDVKVILCVYTRGLGDTIEAVWDDAVGGFSSSGTFTGPVSDLLADGMPLANTSWESGPYLKDNVGVEVRSSKHANMTDASAWIGVGNNQTTGLPTVGRYLQCRVTLTANLACSRTPWVRTLNITHNVPVTKVELSIDDGATWTTATGTRDWWRCYHLPEGRTVVRARAADLLGAVNETSSSFDVDVTPPVGSIVIDDDAPATDTRRVSLDLPASDAFGVSLMMLSEHDSFPGASWRDYCSTVEWDLMDRDGERTVYARFMDGHGIVSADSSDTIVLDTQPPVGTISIDDGARMANRTAVTLRLLATDTYGTADVMLAQTRDMAGGTWVPFAQTVAWTLPPGDGVKWVFAVFRDSLGHASEPVGASILLDATPPTLALAFAGGSPYTATGDVTLDLDAEDAYPLETMQLGTEPDLAGAPIVPFKRSVPWTLPPGDGPSTVYGRVWDGAGNACPIASATIALDTVGPRLAVSIGGGGAFTGTQLVTVEVNASDAIPVARMRVGDWPDLTDAPLRDFEAEFEWTLPAGDGEKAIFVQAWDAAGNLGPVASVNVTLDTKPPIVTLRLRDGIECTASRDVTVELSVYDASGPGGMRIGEVPSPPDAERAPYLPSLCWTLSEGDGGKTLYARVWDLAGNAGQEATCSVLLDTTPPLSGMRQLPACARSASITVAWGATDEGCGVAAYDVQYRDGDGGWIPLATGTEATSTPFTGEDLHTYWFRVRARDLAWNVEPFPERSEDAVTFVLSGVSAANVTILWPPSGAAVRGAVVANGTSSHPNPRMPVTRVMVQLDDGGWVAANGTSVWGLDLDLSGLGPGPHVVRAKAFDGEAYSPVVERAFVVGEPPKEVRDGGPTVALGLGLMAIAAVVAAALLVWRRRASV